MFTHKDPSYLVIHIGVQQICSFYHMNQSCPVIRTYTTDMLLNVHMCVAWMVLVVLHIWMSHVTHMNESCHTYESGISCYTYVNNTQKFQRAFLRVETLQVERYRQSICFSSVWLCCHVCVVGRCSVLQCVVVAVRVCWDVAGQKTFWQSVYHGHRQNFVCCQQCCGVLQHVAVCSVCVLTCRQETLWQYVRHGHRQKLECCEQERDTRSRFSCWCRQEGRGQDFCHGAV